MSKSNKTARQELERICGKGCMFKRARCAQRIEEMGGIKTFKVFVKEKKFRGKKISYQMTFHHLKHKSEGGQTSIENGANVEEIAHQYMHSLPREQEDMGNYYKYIIQCKPGITGYWQVPLFSDKGILQSAKGVA